MNLSLPPELEDFVRREVASGRYPSEDELLLDALRLLQERGQRIEALRAELEPSLHRLDRGEGFELDFEDVKRRGAERAARRRAGQPETWTPR